MKDVSQVLLDVRDVGENILSTGKDIQLLLREANEEKIRHSRDLVENILSLCAYMSALSLSDLDRWEELTDEVRKIEFTSINLRSALTVEAELQSKIKDIFDHLRILEVSSNRIITLSFVSKLRTLKSYNDEDVCYSNKRSCEQACDGVCYEDGFGNEKGLDPNDKEMHGLRYSLSDSLDKEEMCYKDKLACEIDCDGECYEDTSNKFDKLFSPAQESKTKEYSSENTHSEKVCYNDNLSCDSAEEHSKECPEYKEHFTESPFTHIESGLTDDVELSYQTVSREYDNPKKAARNLSTISEEDMDLGAAIRDSLLAFDAFVEENDLDNNGHINVDSEDMQMLANKEDHLDQDNNYPEYIANINSEENILQYATFFKSNEEILPDNDFKRDDLIEEPKYLVKDTEANAESTSDVKEEVTEQTDEYITYGTISPESTASYDYYNSEETTTIGYEVTESSYYTYTTEEAATVGYETTTESYKMEEPTTPTYETTTQDLYKLSQDIYSMANDLSSKANEISSLSSDISSKVSSMGSMVSDLNTYDDDELTKTINSVNKITQEISSKTSDMSSGCSTMSSLASDISSASSDLFTSERRHPIKTTPWQKINSKGQDLVTAAQGVVSAAQEVQSRVGGVVELAKGLRVADAVEAAAYEVTAKAQLIISETLGVASAVLDLMTALER